MALNAYEKRFPLAERRVIERALRMQGGYVLEFSDPTFEAYFHDTFGIDAGGPLFAGFGTSKAKRLRAFLAHADEARIAKVLRGLWKQREADSIRLEEAAVEQKLHDDYFAVVLRIEGEGGGIDTSALEHFEPSQTLDELIEALRRDLDAGKAQATLDRLHTYCMKRFAALVLARGGPPCTGTEPLHSRVGRYLKLLRAERDLTEITDRIVRSAIGTLEALNDIRNNKSLAHDNEELVDPAEARFIFESIAALLRFVKAVDAGRFE